MEVPKFFGEFNRKIDWTKQIYLSNIVKYFQRDASPEEISILMAWLVEKGAYVAEIIKFDWPPPFSDIRYTPTQMALNYGQLFFLPDRDELLAAREAADKIDRQARIVQARIDHEIFEAKKIKDRELHSEWLTRQGNYDSLAQKLRMRWYKHHIAYYEKTSHYNESSYPKDEDCPVRWVCLDCKSSRVKTYNQMFADTVGCRRCAKLSVAVREAPKTLEIFLRIMREQDEAFIKQQAGALGKGNLNSEDSQVAYHEPYVLNDACTRELYDCRCLSCQDKMLTGHKYRKIWYKEDLFEIPALTGITRKERRMAQGMRGLPGYLHITNTHIATAGRGRT